MANPRGRPGLRLDTIPPATVRDIVGRRASNKNSRFGPGSKPGNDLRFSAGNERNQEIVFGNWHLVVGNRRRRGERINQEGRILGPAPQVARPTLFNTPEADAVVSAMQIMPVTNPWN